MGLWDLVFGLGSISHLLSNKRPPDRRLSPETKGQECLCLFTFGAIMMQRSKLPIQEKQGIQ